MKRFIVAVVVSAACLCGLASAGYAGGIRVTCLPSTPCPPPVGTDPAVPPGLFSSPIQPDIGAGVGGPDATFIAGNINFSTSPHVNTIGDFLGSGAPEGFANHTVDQTWFAFYGNAAFSGSSFIKLVFDQEADDLSKVQFWVDGVEIALSVQSINTYTGTETVVGSVGPGTGFILDYLAGGTPEDLDEPHFLTACVVTNVEQSCGQGTPLSDTSTTPPFIVSVPEPSSLVLLIGGIAGLALYRRRRVSRSAVDMLKAA